MQVEHLSVSRIETYLRCPHQYYLEYVKGLKKETEALQFGHLMHSVLEELFKADVLDDPLAFCKDLFEKKWGEEYSLRNHNYFLLGFKMIENFFQHNDYKKMRHNIYLQPELEFSIPLPLYEGGSIDFVGRIDLPLAQDGVMEIVDYKTSLLPKNLEELEADLQMNAYYYAVRKLFPDFKKIRLTLYWLRYNSFTTLERKVEEEGNFIEAFEGFLRGAYYQISRDQVHQPIPNIFCGYCAGKKVCNSTDILLKEVGHLASEENIASKSLQDLIEMYNQVKAYSEILRRKEEEIKETLKKLLIGLDTEEIKVGGKVVKLRCTKKQVFRPDKVYEMLGLENFLEVVEINKKRLEDKLKDNKELLKMLEAIAEYKQNRPYVEIADIPLTVEAKLKDRRKDLEWEGA